MELTPQAILEALKQVKYPGFSRDIVAFGLVRDVEVGGLGVSITLSPPADAAELMPRIADEIQRVVSAMPGAPAVRIVAQAPPQAPGRPASGPPKGAQGIPGVARVVAVASGKGGVGKSTVAANLAMALRAHGRVGLLDADVYGPSAPILLGIEDRKPTVTAEKRIVPIDVHGLRVISMGLFVERERPIIWRGPMVTKLVVEFLRNVEWGELDWLVLDLPPGTGDVQLTLTQQVRIDGGVIVTTPQDVALADVTRGLRMFTQAGIRVLGVVENMSGYVCARCGTATPIFGHGGAERMARELELEVLGTIPIEGSIRDHGDRGTPLAISEPGSETARRFDDLARQVADRLSGARASAPAPAA